MSAADLINTEVMADDEPPATRSLDSHDPPYCYEYVRGFVQWLKETHPGVEMDNGEVRPRWIDLSPEHEADLRGERDILCDFNARAFLLPDDFPDGLPAGVYRAKSHLSPMPIKLATLTRLSRAGWRTLYIDKIEAKIVAGVLARVAELRPELKTDNVNPFAYYFIQDNDLADAKQKGFI